MARKLKKSEEVEAETAQLNSNDASINVEMETKSMVDETEIKPTLAETTGESIAQDCYTQCGGALRAKRIEQALSTQAVAKQLRLGNAQIEALEQNDFSALPEPTIVKGFIRNYAKLLKIPAEPILAAYAELMPRTEQYAFAVGPGINMKISENAKPGSARYLILTVLLLLGLGAWFFYQHYIQKPDVVSPMPEMAEMFPEELALQMTTPNEQQSVIDTQEILDEATTEESALSVEAPESDVATANSEVIAQPQDTAVIEAVVSKTKLEFNATQETWLSVVNKSGKEVYNKILYPGNRDVVEVEQPSEIVVGNAHGTTLIVDGKRVDLAPHTRINVARVQLSQ